MSLTFKNVSYSCSKQCLSYSSENIGEEEKITPFIIGASLSEPHTNRVYEKIAVLMYVCVCP